MWGTKANMVKVLSNPFVHHTNIFPWENKNLIFTSLAVVYSLLASLKCAWKRIPLFTTRSPAVCTLRMGWPTKENQSKTTPVAKFRNMMGDIGNLAETQQILHFRGFNQPWQIAIIAHGEGSLCTWDCYADPSSLTHSRRDFRCDSTKHLVCCVVVRAWKLADCVPLSPPLRRGAIRGCIFLVLE